MDNNTEIAEATNNELFELQITEDRLTVLLSLRPEFAATKNAVDEILEKLNSMGINEIPDNTYLYSLLEKARGNSEESAEIEIIRGKPLVMPVDGRLVWTRDYFARGYKIDLITNKIDFHEKVASPVVHEGDLIIKVIPPQLGQDGIDVFGRPVKVPPVDKVGIKVGPNLRWDEEESGYFAAVSGRLRMAGASLEIQEIFRINGDVGRKTGNINHEGDIIIQGDIDSEYSVEASGTIIINGVVGACNITGGGDMIVSGGINGREDKKIITKGGIKAKYIMNSVLEAGGDVASEIEIVKSRIKADGEVYCGGRIVGGEIIAGTYINANVAGNDKAVTTLLEIRKLEKSDDLETEESAESSAQGNQEESQQTDCIRIEEQVYSGTKFTVLGQRYQVKKRMKGPVVAMIDKQLKQFVLSRYDEKEEPES